MAANPALDAASAEPAPVVTPGRSLANAAVTLLLTRSAGILLAWVLEVALVRTLDPAAWAVMSRFLTLIALFSVAQLGLPESVLYFAARASAPRPALLLTVRTSALLGGLGALLTLPFHALPTLTSRVLGTLGASALSSLSVFVICDLAFAPLPSLLLAWKRQKLASVLSFGTRLLIALFVLSTLLADLGLEAALWAMALGSVCSLVIGWLVVAGVSRGSSAASARRVALGEQLAFSMPVGLARCVQIGNAKLDKYLIMTLFAESVYGTYYLGAVELPIPSMLCTAVMSVLMADLVALAERGDHARLLALWHRSIEKVSLVSLPFFAFAMLFAEPLFVAFYGQAHAGAAGQFRIFQLLLLFRVTNFSSISLALGQPRVPLIAALIALCLNASLSLLAVRMLGLSGPAFANVTSIALSTVYTLWAIRRRLGVPWSTLLPSRAYLRALAIALISALPASAVLLLQLPALLTLVAGVLCYLGVYLYLGRAASLLTAEDRAFVRELFQPRIFGQAASQGAIS